MATATASLPQGAITANTNTLNEAMAAASISSSPNLSEPKELKSDSDLEEGEIRDGDDDDEERDEFDEDGDAEDDGRVKTVFDDQRRFNVKHPLSSTWTLFYDSPATKGIPKTAASTPSTPGPISQIAHGWMEDMRKVVSFKSVEEFWGLYNNIIPPSQLPGKANYYLFKDGIMPAWEDPENKNGGKWVIQVPRDKSKAIIDKMWLYTMLAAIGETFETPVSAPGEEAKVPEQSDLVTGIAVNARPAFYRVQIWTRNAPDVSLPETDPLMKRIMLIGRHFKVVVLGFDKDQKINNSGLQSDINFESHKDSERKGNKNKIIL